MRHDEHGQPVGDPVDWTPGAPLAPVTLVGRSCRLEPLAPEHDDALFRALCVDSPPATWTYLARGPFDAPPGFTAYVEAMRGDPDVVPLAVLLPDGAAVGVATWMRIDHAMGVAEVGAITFGAALQRTTAATEAMHLMAAHAFEVAGVRRYEWKCDSLNEPSRRAAVRLGFTFEGVFRQAVHYKGRNRDTAWYAITDRDWPGVRRAHESWLDPANFDEHGRQRRPLATPTQEEQR